MSPVPHGGHPPHRSPFPAGPRGNRTPSPRSSSACCSHYVKPQPVPHPPFSCKYKDHLAPKPSKGKTRRFVTSLWLDTFNVQDASRGPEEEEEEPAVRTAQAPLRKAHGSAPVWCLATSPPGSDTSTRGSRPSRRHRSSLPCPGAGAEHQSRSLPGRRLRAGHGACQRTAHGPRPRHFTD